MEDEDKKVSYLELDLEPDLIEQLQEEADKRGVSLNDFIGTIISALLQEEFDKAVEAGQISEDDFGLFAATGGTNNEEE